MRGVVDGIAVGAANDAPLHRLTAISDQPSAIVRFRVRMPSLYDRFNLVSDFELAGDQERAIGELTDGLQRGDKHQGVLGGPGSGKAFTKAQTIPPVNPPALVNVHNKTL